VVAIAINNEVCASSEADNPEVLSTQHSSSNGEILIQRSSLNSRGNGPALMDTNSSSKIISTLPCNCSEIEASWKPCLRNYPMCIFIDLGAADGNTFATWLQGGFGNLSNCPSGGEWQAILVEANPYFDDKLTELGPIEFDCNGSCKPGRVYPINSTAAYMCEGQTSFYIDSATTEHNYWGSSMSNQTPDVVQSGQNKVTVPTMNLMRILFENTLPIDYVLVKMDIEGSEWDVIPCLAKSPSAYLIDRMFTEEHSPTWGQAGTTLEQMEQAKLELRSKGVDIPQYFSETLFEKSVKSL